MGGQIGRSLRLAAGGSPGQVARGKKAATGTEWLTSLNSPPPRLRPTEPPRFACGATVMGELLEPFLRRQVDQTIFTLAHRDHGDHEHLAMHLVDPAKTRGAQLDLVAIRQSVQTGGRNGVEPYPLRMVLRTIRTTW